MREHGLPDVVAPVRGDGREDQGLEFDVFAHQAGVHADPGGGGGFAVEVPGRGEVVEAGFQGGFEVEGRVVRVRFVD